LRFQVLFLRCARLELASASSQMSSQKVTCASSSKSLNDSGKPNFCLEMEVKAE